MRIYTKTGDGGETGLFGGGRVAKDHPRIVAYGTLDELNASLGMVRTEVARATWDDSSYGAELDGLLHVVQNRLFDLGAELASPGSVADPSLLIAEEQINDLETAIDSHEATLPPLKQFVLPGGSPTGSALHMARCICRRAERLAVTLGHREEVREPVIRYLNRLSDLLFVLARSANQALGKDDIPWQKSVT